MGILGVRGVFTMLVLGFAAIVFARRLAYYEEWEPRTFRIVGIVVSALGTFGVWDLFGPGPALKLLSGFAPLIGVYIWQDIGLERAELEREARECEEAAGITLEDEDEDEDRE